MELTTIVFHMDSQPDYEKLKERGWSHPVGLYEEPLVDSLVKDFEGHQIQIVHHRHGDFSYTEAFLHPKQEELMRKTRKKGEGRGMSVSEATWLITKLYEECGNGP